MSRTYCARTPRRWRLLPLAAGWLLLGAHSGCTLTNPLVPAQPGRLLQVPALSEVQASAHAASAAACAASQGAGCLGVDSLSGHFYGDLQYALLDVDARRRELLTLAAGTASDRATFNALLWPIGGFALYRGLQPGASGARDAVGTALAGATLFGAMNSGVPERERRYIDTARRLGCAMLRSSAFLYPHGDIAGGTEGLVPATDTLRKEAGKFASQRNKLLYTLEARQTGGAPTCANDTSCRRQRLLNGTPTAASPGDPVGDFERITGDRLAAADAALRAARAMRSRIENAGLRLRLEAREIDGALMSALAASAPAVLSIDTVLAQLRTALPAPAAPASSATAKLQGAEQSHGAAAATTVRGLRSRLTKDSVDQVNSFEQNEGLALERAHRAIEDWLEQDHARTQLVGTELVRLQCSIALASIATAAAPAAPADSRPATTASPPSGTLLRP